MTALFDLGAPDVGAGDVGFGDVGFGGGSDTERAQRVLDEAKADHAFAVALDHAEQVGGRDGLRRLRRYTARIAAVESKILKEFVQDDGNTRRAERALDDGRTSKKEQRKKASRARAVGENPDLATKLADQELSEEQLDVIADASAKTDGAAANDNELIDKVAAAPPEQGKGIVDRYLADRATADGIQTEHNRQRALRRAFNYNSKKDGLDTIAIAGDGVASKAMWDAIDKRADEIYKRDGDRDVAHAKHPRTRDQRLFDAAHEIICGITTTPTGQTQPQPVTAADAHAASKASKRYTPAKKSSTTTRPQIVIALTIDKLLGRDPAAVALQHGLGLIPDTVLADYAAHADIIAALFDRNGEPLWLGRLKRYATPQNTSPSSSETAAASSAAQTPQNALERTRQRPNKPRRTRPALRTLPPPTPHRRTHHLPRPTRHLAHPPSNPQRNTTKPTQHNPQHHPVGIDHYPMPGPHVPYHMDRAPLLASALSGPEVRSPGNL